jgi:hypothetical protein
MAEPNIIVYDKLYVTVQGRSDAQSETGHLGFASPYTKDAAFLKRKTTQDNWAYGYGTDWVINDEDEITQGENHRSELNMAMLFVTQAYPRIVVNEPREGFEIAKSVRRWGWRGSGNVVWRITDPAGYDLEISSENFASILDCTTVEKGKILAKCVWGRENGKNILLPEGSDPYNAAMNYTTKTKKKVSLKDIKIGDTVNVLNKGMEAEDWVYYGKMWIYTEMPVYHDRYSSKETKSSGKLTDRYVFRSTIDGKFAQVSTPKVTDLVESAATEMTKEEAARIINRDLGKDWKVGGTYYGTSLVYPTKPGKDQTPTFTLVPVNDGDVFVEHEGKKVFKSFDEDAWSRSAVLRFAILDGKAYMCSNNREHIRVGASYSNLITPRLVEVSYDALIKRGAVELVGSMVNEGTHVWNRRMVFTPNLMTQVEYGSYFDLEVRMGEFSRLASQSMDQTV